MGGDLNPLKEIQLATRRNINFSEATIVINKNSHRTLFLSSLCFYFVADITRSFCTSKQNPQPSSF